VTSCDRHKSTKPVSVSVWNPDRNGSDSFDYFPYELSDYFPSFFDYNFTDTDAYADTDTDTEVDTEVDTNTDTDIDTDIDFFTSPFLLSWVANTQINHWTKRVVSSKLIS